MATGLETLRKLASMQVVLEGQLKPFRKLESLQAMLDRQTKRLKAFSSMQALLAGQPPYRSMQAMVADRMNAYSSMQAAMAGQSSPYRSVPAVDYHTKSFGKFDSVQAMLDRLTESLKPYSSMQARMARQVKPYESVQAVVDRHLTPFAKLEAVQALLDRQTVSLKAYASMHAGVGHPDSFQSVPAMAAEHMKLHSLMQAALAWQPDQPRSIQAMAAEYLTTLKLPEPTWHALSAQFVGLSPYRRAPGIEGESAVDDDGLTAGRDAITRVQLELLLCAAVSLLVVTAERADSDVVVRRLCENAVFCIALLVHLSAGLTRKYDYIAGPLSCWSVGSIARAAYRGLTKHSTENRHAD